MRVCVCVPFQTNQQAFIMLNVKYMQRGQAFSGFCECYVQAKHRYYIIYNIKHSQHYLPCNT